MTVQKELLIWLACLIGAATGFYLLAFYVKGAVDTDSVFISHLLQAAPALSAALGLPAFFLLLRFCLNSPLFNARPSRSRHILAAILVSLTAIITLKALKMYLLGISFPFIGFAGALLGSLLFWMFWQLTKGWLDNGHKQ